MSIWTNINKRSEGSVIRQEEVIFNPMIYQPDRDNPEIIVHDTYKGVEYYVVNYGTHPCAYVICQESFLKKYSTEYGELDCAVSVHGGVTYNGKIGKLQVFPGKPGYCFGWDYAHTGDWDGKVNDFENRIYEHIKYTTEMLVADCKLAIDQYQEVLKKDESIK